MTYHHIPVLLDEVIRYLQPQPGQIFVDGTAGGGGHTLALAERVGPTGRVIALDLDPVALAAVRERATNLPSITLVHGNFRHLADSIRESGVKQVNGILLDLGLSSAQLADHERGFSFESTAGLDMRFDQSSGQAAADIIQTYSVDELTTLFKTFGEERLSRPIAQAIVQARQQAPINSAQELQKIIATVYGRQYHRPGRINPATKVFQALRIAVNEELTNLAEALPAAIESLIPGGRLAVISYHSLEDRIVKQFFQTQSRDCLCPPSFPVCQCGHIATIKKIMTKPVTASVEEQERNSRSRSAKLRVAERIPSFIN